MQNGTLFQFFHWYYPADGSLWKLLATDAKHLSQLGITGVWLPPASKGSKGAESDGYDVYDLYDLGEFDQQRSVRTKYGTKEEYLAAVRAAHDSNMQVYADVILNHLCGADGTEQVQAKRVNPDNRQEFISGEETIEACTRFTYPGRKGRYSAFSWDHNCFSGVDFDNAKKEQAIFSILNGYGDGWEEVADRELGNYDYLIGSDIEFRNPAVREEIKRWGAWFIQETGVDGFRMDAVKHIAPGFINEWIDHVREQAGKNFFVVGEYWSPEKLDDMLAFIAQTEGRLSLFDACLHRNIHLAASAGREYDLRTIFDRTLVSANASLAVTLVGNHDTQPMQLLETIIEPWFKTIAYSLILLRNTGYPCVFYPDLYGARYKDKNQHGEEQEVVLEPVPHLDRLLKARKYIAYGQQRDYLDYPTCIGWTRQGNRDHPHSGCAVLLSNADRGEKRMKIGREHAGKTFRDYLGHCKDSVIIDDEGWGQFFCEAGHVSVWVCASWTTH